MPAAATPMRPRAVRTSTRRMMVRRTIMATIIMMIITMTTVITMTSIATMIIITAIPMLMTTSKAPPIGDPGGMREGEAAALYRLMTWLSPSFPVGAFSYSSGIGVGGGSRRYRRRRVVAGLAGRDAHRWLGICDGVFLAHAHRLRRRATMRRWQASRSCRGVCAVARASARDIGRKAARSSRSRARHGIAMVWTR